MVNDDANHGQEGQLDRLIICPFGPNKGTEESHQLYLFKASSSVLLTLVLPEESSCHEEEIALLRNPQALWTVLVINGSSRSASDNELLEHLTPIAQYLRGITASLSAQRINVQSIFDALKDHLRKSDEDSLFDDEQFTKSRLYHWVVETCHELCGSIASNLRFVRRLLDNQINKLSSEAHIHETLGIAYWARRLEEEVFELDELQAQVHALREKVRESVSTPSFTH